MTEIHKHINSELKSNNNIKIKNDISEQNHLYHSHADKFGKFGNKNSNYSPIEESATSSYWNKKNSNNNKSAQRNEKRQTSIKNKNSVKKRIKDKINKDKVDTNKEKDNLGKKKQLNNNVKSPQNPQKNSLNNNKSKLHKRVNSLHFKEKENKKNIKIINNNQNNANLNSINLNKEKEQHEHDNLSNNTNTNTNTNVNSIENPFNKKLKASGNNIDSNISSSNNISFSSDNKFIKSEKNDSNTMNQKKYNVPMQIDEIEPNDMYFSFNKNSDINNVSVNAKEKEQNKNFKSNIQINSNTLSGKIASRAKNLNKILEENFNNIKKERKEKELKKQEKKADLIDKINSNNISVNDLGYSTINNSGKINFGKIARPRHSKPFSSDLEQKKKKMQHKTARLNHSLELRNRHKMKDNLNCLDNNNNNYNLNSHVNQNNNTGNKPLKVFSKSDFRQMNTSPFVRSKPPIRPKHTNCLPRKASLKKKDNNNNNNINVKSLDKKFNSPQKEINRVKGVISLNFHKKNNNSINNSIFNKKKKLIAKRKNKSMIIEDKPKEKGMEKINENEINSKLKIDKSNKNKTIDINSDMNKSANTKKPIRAQSQQEINTELVLDNLNEILENDPEGIEKIDVKKIVKIEKVITKLQTLCKKGFAGPGVKKTNQDNFFIYNNFNNNSNFIYLGVCDGHGMFGQDVSGYLVNTLPQNMNTNLLTGDISSLAIESTDKLYPIISSTFISTNIDMTEDERVDSSFSGSTCVTLFYTPSRLICANVGDSRCVIGKFDGQNWKSKNLSRDQKPSEQDEYDRIINSGGRIESFKDENGNYIGPERVWLKDEDVPGLAMSRSFGDEVAHTVGVITEPEINEYFFMEEDKFIIIASDGLWEFISSDECVLMVKDFYLKNDIDGAMSYLYKESSKRWIMEEEVIDDITILMAFLK